MSVDGATVEEMALSKAIMDTIDTDEDGTPSFVIQSIIIAEIVRTGTGSLNGSLNKELVVRTTGEPTAWALLGMLDVAANMIANDLSDE